MILLLSDCFWVLSYYHMRESHAHQLVSVFPNFCLFRNLTNESKRITEIFQYLNDPNLNIQTLCIMVILCAYFTVRFNRTALKV